MLVNSFHKFAAEMNKLTAAAALKMKMLTAVMMVMHILIGCT